MAIESQQKRAGEEDALSRLREYGVPILVGAVLALLVVGGYQVYRFQKRAAANRASALLLNASSPQQLEEIANEYPDTPSGPAALLSLAANYYSNGQYEQAQQAYRDFEAGYPNHPLRYMADYGAALCLEATGYLDRALDAYGRFIRERPDHYLTPLATLGRGRVLKQLGQLEEARVVLEDFIAENPGSPWVQDAESLLLFVQKESRARAAPVPERAPATFDFSPAEPANPE